ncbi:MAG: tol-pal system protein YbgF [Rhodobacterales bacterium]|nr:MAG: tol-pal system protein YbgF [Rhodobacterales bacterium]
MGWKTLAFSAALAAALPLASTAQDGAPNRAPNRAQTLADIRQELTVLYVELQRLGTELNTTGAVQLPAGGGGTLDRVNALEAEIGRLTGQIEQIEHRISALVRDGTNRVGDLEFRLCELETDCDVASLGDTPTLGGGALPEVPAAPLPTTMPLDPGAGSIGGGGGGELAVAEQADFDRAREAFDAGDMAGAAEGFSRFAESYPGGPLTADASFFAGEALTRQGRIADAARAYLAAYSAVPPGQYTTRALLKLGAALGELGHVTEACVMFDELLATFPMSDEVGDAEAARAALACP